MADYTHVLWDWNGTLLNDIWLCREIGNRLLSEHNLPELTLEDYRKAFDFPIIKYYERTGFDWSIHSFEELSIDYITEYEMRRHECSLQPQAKAVLARVCASKRQQAILSAYKQDTLETFVAHHELEPFFTVVRGHHDIYAAGKEASARELMTELGAEPARTLLVGDTLHDAEIAEHIGADCVLLTHGHQDEARLRTCGVPMMQTLADVADWLEC